MKKGSILLLSLTPLLGLTFTGSPTGPLATPQQKCQGRVVTVSGTKGDDVLFGTTGGDVIAARKGKDNIFGLSGADRICGGRGDDLINGGPGFDKARGGRGVDTCHDSEVKKGCEN